MYELIAYTGTALSLVLFAAMVFGFLDLDLDVDTDSDSAFKVFSLQNVSYFAMVGGWAGIWSSKQDHSELSTLFYFLLAGSLAVALSQVLMKFAKRLNHKTKVDYNSAVGKEGRVTVSISPGATGKVQTIVNGKLVELSARYYQDDKFVPTGSLVRIEEVSNVNELIVS